MNFLRLIDPLPRPYWHVDAKWVCGILLIFCLGITLFLATVVKLTDEKRGPKIAALVVGSMFIRGDSLGDIEETKKELQKRGGVIRPISYMPDVTITEADLTLTTAEIKIKVFGPLTEQIYHKGIKGTAAGFAASPEQKEKFVKDASLLRLFTKDVHDTMKKQLIVPAVASVILLLGVFYFSAGWGSLGNPGLVLLAIGIPGTIASLMINHPPKNGDRGGLGFLPPDVAREMGSPVGEVYYPVAVAGIILIIAAVLGKIISRSIKDKPAS